MLLNLEGISEAADALIITRILSLVFPLLTWEQPALISITAAAISVRIALGSLLLIQILITEQSLPPTPSPSLE